MPLSSFFFKVSQFFSRDKFPVISGGILIIYGILTSHLSQHPGVLFAAMAIIPVAVLCRAGLAWGRKTAAARALVIPALVLSVAFVFAFERTREFIRGP